MCLASFLYYYFTVSWILQYYPSWKNRANKNLHILLKIVYKVCLGRWLNIFSISRPHMHLQCNCCNLHQEVASLFTPLIWDAMSFRWPIYCGRINSVCLPSLGFKKLSASALTSLYHYNLVNKPGQNFWRMRHHTQREIMWWEREAQPSQLHQS